MENSRAFEGQRKMSDLLKMELQAALAVPHGRWERSSSSPDEQYWLLTAKQTFVYLLSY